MSRRGRNPRFGLDIADYFKPKLLCSIFEEFMVGKEFFAPQIQGTPLPLAFLKPGLKRGQVAAVEILLGGVQPGKSGGDSFRHFVNIVGRKVIVGVSQRVDVAHAPVHLGRPFDGGDELRAVQMPRVPRLYFGVPGGFD